MNIVSAKLAKDGESAMLTLAQALTPNQHYLLDTRNVKDISPNGNPMQLAPVEVRVTPPVFTLENFVADGRNRRRWRTRACRPAGTIRGPSTVSCGPTNSRTTAR